MSQSEIVYPLAKAQVWLAHYLAAVQPYCKRAVGVGSVRRKKQGVHDLEMIVIPLPGEYLDLFGQAQKNLLDENIETLAVDWGAKLEVNGPATKRLILREGPKLEIYVSTPGRWGVEMVIKTGDSDFSRMAVTQRNFGGYLPNDSVIKNGWQVYQNGAPVPMLEEGDFLQYLGFPRNLDPVVRSRTLKPR